MKWVVFSLKVALFIGGFYVASQFCYKKTDRFTVQAIRSQRPYNAQWEGRPLTAEEEKEVRSALDLKYTYYGRGGQSFIFFSEGEKYVLKFFRQKVFKTPFYLDYMPSLFSRYEEKKRWKKADKLERDFTSYKYAFNDLQDLTGVLYIHLNPTDHLKREVVLVDRLGIEHKIPLDGYDFVLQRKAFFVYDRINEAMVQGHPERAESAIAQIMHLIVERSRRGFHDRDPNVRTNCGFIGEKAIKIDVGRLVPSESIKRCENYAKELVRITRPFKEWIGQNHPTLIPFFEKELIRYTHQGES